jgi:sporulation protein YlmC with PRC-barrel domain
MEKTLSDLQRLTIAATDGDLGSVVDLCFDDRSWTIRYLVVDAGSWFPDRWALISPISVRSWAQDPSILRSELSKTQVKISAEAHIPNGLPERPPQPYALEHAVRDRARAGGETHLQVATAVLGYTFQTEDGTIGHVQDILVDDQAWAIRYLLVDTENRWGGKKVLVSPAWLTHVSWDESKTFFSIATAVCDSPRNGSTRLRHATRAAGIAPP